MSAIMHVLDNYADSYRKPPLELLISLGADVNYQNEKGQTPLHFAATQKNVVYTEILLKLGADATLTDNHGKSALHHAALARGNSFYGKAQFPKDRADIIVPVLYKAGLNLNLKDKDGNTAADYALFPLPFIKQRQINLF